MIVIFFGFFFFFFNDTATTEIYTLSLHDALPISGWLRVTWRASPWKTSHAPMRWSPDRPVKPADRRPRSAGFTGRSRSEEHTSELQSLAYLVCRLLLEKKKNYTFIPDRPDRILWD